MVLAAPLALAQGPALRQQLAGQQAGLHSKHQQKPGQSQMQRYLITGSGMIVCTYVQAGYTATHVKQSRKRLHHLVELINIIRQAETCRKTYVMLYYLHASAGKTKYTCT